MILFLLLFSVTGEHPEVQAMVLSAMEKAKQSSAASFGLYADLLEKRIKEVCQRFKTQLQHLNS